MTATEVGGHATPLEDLLAGATARLLGAGVPGARAEAVRIWTGLTDADPARVVLETASVSSALGARFEAAVARRVDGEPLAYVIGRAGFRTLDLAVDRRVLIPRPETEGLVQHVLDWVWAAGRTGSVADLGTGSGCVALALAVEGPFDRVVATDVSPDALAVAQANRDRIARSCPVEFRRGRWLAPLGEREFDVIVSNPPYVAPAEWRRLDPGVRNHEPREALVADDEGLQDLTELLLGAAHHLTPGGLLALEIDARRADETLAVARAAGWVSARIHADVFGRLRYLVAEAAA